MKKRFLSALLCVAMVASLVIGCGAKEEQPTTEEVTEETAEETAEEEPKEPVEIHYWYNNVAGPQEYTQQVEDELNEMLAVTEGYEHITLKLHPCKDYATDIALAQASGEQVDVISTPGLNVSAEIENGAWLALDDLLAANPEITEDLPEWFMDYGKVDGVTWFVPNYQQLANQWFWITPKEFLDNSGYTEEEVREIILSKDVDRVGEFYKNYILAIREYMDSETIYMNGDMISNARYFIQPSNDIYQVDWNGVFYWDEEAEKINFTALNEGIQAGYLKNGEMYVDGILYKDALTDTGFQEKRVSERSYVFDFVQLYGTEEMAEETRSAIDGCEIVAINVHDYIFLSNSNAAGGTAISSTCESPEDAAKVVALLFNDKYEEIYNKLVFGIEGIHYEWVNKDTKQINTLEFHTANAQAGTTYAFQKWRGGNSFNAWLNQSMTPEQQKYIIEEINESENTVKTPLMGFTLNTKPVESELSQVTSVVKEYIDALKFGIKGADTPALLDEYLDKLEAAGLSKILDEFNAQADDFLGR